ncbi:MAG: LCP family protein, partial [Chloroflexota bacterium]|nr:LCP family protein [Chloroflexota bacterium]
MKRQFMPFNNSAGKQNPAEHPEHSGHPIYPPQPPQAPNWGTGNAQAGIPSMPPQGMYPQYPSFNSGQTQQQAPTMQPWIPGTTASGMAPSQPFFQGQNAQPFNPPSQPVMRGQNSQPFSSSPQNGQPFGPSTQNAQPFNAPFQNGQPPGSAQNGRPSSSAPHNQNGQPFGFPQNRQPFAAQAQAMQNGAPPVPSVPSVTSVPSIPSMSPLAPNNWQQNGPPPFVQPPGNNGREQGGQGGQGPTPNKKTHKKRRFPIWARIVVGILTVLLILVGSGTLYYLLYLAPAVSSITDHSLTHHDTYTTDKKKGQPNQPQTKVNLGPAYSGGRLNILLLGSDDDQKTILTDGMLAQTNIIVSIDPTTKNISLLTIPRDSLVTTPTGRLMKLDEVFFEGGGAAQKKDNAAGLVADTLLYDFGIHIDRFAWVGLTGFTKVIHTLGGVDINVTHSIVDDQYPNDTLNPNGKTDIYALKRLYLPPGPQHLDDLTALEYVRSRHADLVGDIGRGARQQQVLNQLKSKVENPDILTKLPELMNDLKGYLQTSIPQSDMISLANLARQINPTKINKILLNGSYSKTAENFQTDRAANASVVILNCALIQPLIDKAFNLNGHAKCNTGVDFNTNQRVPVSSASVSPVTPLSPSADISNPVATSNSSSSSTQAQIPHLSTMGINGSGGFDNWFGLRSLLDMLFCVTF